MIASLLTRRDGTSQFEPIAQVILTTSEFVLGFPHQWGRRKGNCSQKKIRSLTSHQRDPESPELASVKTSWPTQGHAGGQRGNRWTDGKHSLCEFFQLTSLMRRVSLMMIAGRRISVKAALLKRSFIGTPPCRGVLPQECNATSGLKTDVTRHRS
jgi:hypothetical protein